jgi:cytochrome P450
MLDISLNSTTIVTSLFALPATLLVLYIVRQTVFHPLSRFPGPLLPKLTPWWRVYHELLGDLPFVIHTLHQQYGSTIRIAPDELSSVSPDFVDSVLKGGRSFPKSNYYDGSGGIKPNVFSTRDETFHALRRRQMSYGFSPAGFLRMEGLFDRHCEILLAKLKESGNQELKLDEVLKMYAQDVNGELSFSKSDEFLQEDPHGIQKLPPMNVYMIMAKVYGYVPGLRGIVQSYGDYLPVVSGVLKSRGMLIGQVIKYAKIEYEKRKLLNVEKTHELDDQGRVNLMTNMVLAKDPETGADMQMVDVAGEAVSFMVAGSHSTATAIAFFFAVLLRDEAIREKVTKEIRELVPVHAEELEKFTGLENKLPYTNAVIKEVFRMYPTVNHPIGRVTPLDQIVTLSDKVIPSSTTVGAVAFAVHRNPAIFGGDAQEFRPERWLDESYKKNERYLLHFGQGHRGCIGKNMALITIWKAVVSVLQRYEVEAVRKVDGDASNVPMIGRGFADLRDGLVVRLKNI